MEGLEFLRPMGEQQKEIIAQNKELADLIKRVLSRPLPAPVINVDSDELANRLAQLMGDPEGRIKQADSALQSTLNGFVKSAENVPKSVSIRGEFYGFTGWKPCAAYCLTLGLFACIAAYSWHYNSDNEKVNRLQKDRTILNAEMELFKKNNPVLTDKYFPEYMSVWDKTKLWWKKINEI